MERTIMYKTSQEIINILLNYSSVPHIEYESVSLYGESDFIIEILETIIREFQCISLASINITSSETDPVEKNLYVLSITDDNELFVQNAWNGKRLYSCESKAILCDDKSYDLLNWQLEKRTYIEKLIKEL